MSTVGVKGLINSYLVTAGPGVYLASPITPGHNDDFHLFQWRELWSHSNGSWTVTHLNRYSWSNGLDLRPTAFNVLRPLPVRNCIPFDPLTHDPSDHVPALISGNMTYIVDLCLSTPRLLHCVLPRIQRQVHWRWRCSLDDGCLNGAEMLFRVHQSVDAAQSDGRTWRGTVCGTGDSYSSRRRSWADNWTRWTCLRTVSLSRVTRRRSSSRQTCSGRRCHLWPCRHSALCEEHGEGDLNRGVLGRRSVTQLQLTKFSHGNV